jgi:hypothetical protein
VVGAAAGCSHHGSATRQTGRALSPELTPAAAHVLRGRRLAVGLDRDVWVARAGRLTNASRHLRLSLGGTGCYSDSGRAGPCYTLADPFSVSPDGGHLAFFMQHPVVGESTDPTLLVVSSFDGSDGHSVEKASPCGLCSVSTPSWDRNNRSFVVSEEAFMPPTYDNSVSKVYRVAIATRKVTLLSAAGFRGHSEYDPVVSPSGRWIAALRSVRTGALETLILKTPRTHVELMHPDGGRRTLLPFPVRGYTSLWWCGGSNALCAAGPAAAYRIDLRSRRISRLRGPRYDALSDDGTFALTARRTGRGWTALAGPIEPGGSARLAAILRSSSRRDPFGAFSVSDPR